MHAVFRDARYGVRSLRHSPGLTTVAVFALTLGIGLTTTLFSIVYGVLLKGLPYPGGDRILVVSRTNPSRNIRQQPLPIQDFRDYRAQQHTFVDLGAYTSGTMNVSGPEKAERFMGSWVTANTFGMLGVHPMLGRDFRAGEDAPTGEKVAMLAYRTWKQRYNGDPGILGRAVRVNGVPYTVVGVMPDGFAFPSSDALWLPLQTDAFATKRGEGQFVTVFGRLKEGVTTDQAAVDASTIAKRLASTYKESNEGYDAVVKGFVDSNLGPEPTRLLYTMLGAVFFVLLIACANVANLLLDRAAHRTKEVGIRTALGASRGAVIRQFLTEALVLCLTATVLGVGLAYWGIQAFNRAIADTQPPFFIDIRLHLPVLVFSVGVAVLASLVSGAIPAYQSARADINEILKDESRGASSFRIGRISKSLVVFEIALSCGLLVAAGLMIKSVARTRTMDHGFPTNNVFTARVGFPASYTDTTRQRQFFAALAQRVSAIPGVESAAISSGIPGADQGMGYSPLALEGKTYTRDRDYPMARTLAVMPSFFATLRIPLVEGRLFTPSDREGTLPVAVVTRAFAKKFFPNADPIGRRVRLGTSTSTQPWVTIVGVIGDVYGGDQDQPHAAGVFQPFAQAHSSFASITARTAGAPLAITPDVRALAAELDPDIPLYWIYSLDETLARPLWFVRVFGTMFMIFGFVALFLASVGLYAVMSFSVSRRTREVGIRMALGASGARVVRMIFRQGLLQLVAGIAIGLALAAGVSQLLTVVLFDVQPRDPVIFGSVATVLTAVGLLACLVPARRATAVDPLVALRAD